MKTGVYRSNKKNKWNGSQNTTGEYDLGDLFHGLLFFFSFMYQHAYELTTQIFQSLAGNGSRQFEGQRYATRLMADVE